MILFLLCTDATNVTEVKVKLGQNAILTCSVNISNMYWYLEIHSQLRGYILRTFGATDNKPLYCTPEFKTKYSVQNNSLVVKNVTAEDCRLYFCGGKKSGIIHFEETIQLVSGKFLKRCFSHHFVFRITYSDFMVVKMKCLPFK